MIVFVDEMRYNNTQGNSTKILYVSQTDAINLDATLAVYI